MHLGLGLQLSQVPLYGGTTGVATGLENYLLDETGVQLLTETGEELLLES